MAIEHLFDESRGMERAVGLSYDLNATRLSRLKVIADLDATKAYLEDAFTSISAFLTARCGMGVRAAHREVFLARALASMPTAVGLAEAGRLSVDQLEVLAYAQARHPEEFADGEETLAEAASGLDLTDTRSLVDYWVQAHDVAAGDEAASEPAKVHLSKTWKGRGRLDGDLDPELLALMETALGPLIDELINTTPNSDRPAYSQLRAEALAEILRRHLNSGEAPTDHGNRPHVAVVVDWETLTGERPGGTSELLDGTIVSPATAQRLACDANVCRLLTGPNSEILDLGRSKRTVSAAQWKALRVRDRHCQFAGCRRPWTWCDAHHLIAWIQGGLTDIGELVLVCRFHHTLLHEGGWTVRGKPGSLVFVRPNGTVLAA